jgi:hypothetical protein
MNVSNQYENVYFCILNFVCFCLAQYLIASACNCCVFSYNYAQFSGSIRFVGYELNMTTSHNERYASAGDIYLLKFFHVEKEYLF